MTSTLYLFGGSSLRVNSLVPSAQYLLVVTVYEYKPGAYFTVWLPLRLKLVFKTILWRKSTWWVGMLRMGCFESTLLIWTKILVSINLITSKEDKTWGEENSTWTQKAVLQTHHLLCIVQLFTREVQCDSSCRGFWGVCSPLYKVPSVWKIHVLKRDLCELWWI